VSALWLLIGAALLAITGLRVAVALSPRSLTGVLVGAYVVGQAELILVALGLSAFREFKVWPVLVVLSVLCAASLLFVPGEWRIRVPDLRPVFSDPAVAFLAVVVVLGLAYTVVLSLWVPQVEDDALTAYLYRAALWRQHHGITYLHGVFDGRVNSYTPGADVGFLTTMTLGGSGRYTGLAQALACLATVAATMGTARRIGLGRREALFGGLLVATLPVVALQAGAALEDLTLASYLTCAAMFLLDRRPVAPLLAGVASGLAVAAKLSAPLGIVFLLLLAVIARPVKRWPLRAFAVLAGSALGAFWYVVNLVKTQAVSPHVVTQFKAFHHGAAQHSSSLLPAVARILRFGIEFVDVAGSVGRDRYLYGVVAVVVLVAALGTGLLAGRRDRLRLGTIAAAIAALPIVLLPFGHFLERAYYKFWLLLGRRGLAELDPGRNLTRAASNFSWFGPLGSLALLGAAGLTVYAVRRRRLDWRALVLVAAPLYWLIAFGAVTFYQEWAGRFFIFSMALAAATWGLLLRSRAVAWGVVAIASTTLFLTLVNDAKRPSGLPLLQRSKPRSIWSTPRWVAEGRGRTGMTDVLRFVDRGIPASANLGLAITPSSPGYPFFGAGLDRKIEFVSRTQRDTKVSDWVLVQPDRHVSLCTTRWHSRPMHPGEWTIMRRRVGPAC
jgi:hypothetical protein